MLRDAFEHHIWATIRVLDACSELSADQGATVVPGTFGSILDTLRHLVGADASYLVRLNGGRTTEIEEMGMRLSELRVAMVANGEAWRQLLEDDIDPERVIVRHRDDGSETHATAGLRIAQALHHGTDHRSQVCTALTSIGVEPPLIDLWDFGIETGRVHETPPTA
jgi:uncharacterized damage-inducible protein DinB